MCKGRCRPLYIVRKLENVHPHSLWEEEDGFRHEHAAKTSRLILQRDVDDKLWRCRLFFGLISLTWTRSDEALRKQRITSALFVCWEGNVRDIENKTRASCWAVCQKKRVLLLSTATREFSSQLSADAILYHFYLKSWMISFFFFFLKHYAPVLWF